jgi:hypothetical protein
VTVDVDDDADYFEITLALSGAACPVCCVPREPGPCPECGAEVPVCEEVNDLARARQAALGPLLQEVETLRAAFNVPPNARINISPGQYAAAITDSGLFRLMSEMPALGYVLSHLDVNDPKTIGGPVRRAVQGQIEALQQLLEACQELGIFKPAGPAAELRELAVEAGQWGADVVLSLLRAVTAGTFPEARSSQEELQRLLHETPLTAHAEMLDHLPEWVVSDVDERVSLALDRPGRYSDDFGFLDFARVFGAFAGEEQPFIRVAEQARRFLGHLLWSGAPPQPETDVVLVLPAATLAALDRPFHAHRLARMVRELFDEAWARDPDAVRGLVQRTTAQGPLVFAAAARIQKGFNLMTLQDEAGLLDADDVITGLLRTYLDAAETSFRTLGWLVVDLDAIAEGGSVMPATQPPTLGSLEQQLAATAHPAGPTLVACSDSDLRNACGHAQYRWEASTETLVDLRTEQRWALEELEDRMDGLVAGITGTDTGYCASVVDRQIELPEPSWLRSGEAPAAVQFLAAAILGACGQEVIAVNQDSSEIVLAAEAVDPATVLPALAGLAASTVTGREIQVLAHDGRVLLAVEVSSLEEALAAPDELKDLAVLAPFLSAARSVKNDAAEALAQVVAIQVMAICMNAVPALTADPGSKDLLGQVARRLDYVRSFARENQSEPPLAERVFVHLSRARSEAVQASRGEHKALRRLGKEFSALIQWAGKQDVRWPPF